LALDKDFFAECISVPRVLLSVNAVVTESSTLPSAALGKDSFVSTRQKALGKEPDSGSVHCVDPYI
jgi:hypothetical protein